MSKGACLVNQKYSYVTILTDDSYTYGICLLIESMKKVNTKYPLLVLITEDVSEPSLEILRQLNIKIQKINKIQISDYIYSHNFQINSTLSVTWKNCWTKFQIFNLIEYDKIVFLDADIMILKNLDHLFEKPHMTAALDGEYWNLWPNWPHFNSGCLVIEPSTDLFNNILNFAKTLPQEKIDSLDYVIADQEILNLYYSDWPNQYELHLNKYYNIFAPYCEENQLEDLKQNTFFVHYVGRKPWKQFAKHPSETYSEYFYDTAADYIETNIKKLDWNKITEKNILTVYAICKNEMQVIERWLNSFQLADYICILDTGSTDGTWEYLQEQQKKYKNLIIKQQTISPWRYDAARNESMKLIPKETTIFFMADIDEIVEPKDLWPTIIKNSWTPTFTRGVYTYQRDVAEDGTVLKSMQEYRIHNKHWHQWINVVHEALVDETGEKYFFDFDCTPINITVWHLNSHRKEPHKYSQLCENELKEHPENDIMHLQAAIEYEIEDNLDKAYEHFKYLIQLGHNSSLQNFELARCFFGMANICLTKESINEALNFYREGRLIAPYCAECYVGAAQVYINNQQIQEALNLYLGMVQNCHQSYWCSAYEVDSWMTYYTIAQCYTALKNYDNALVYTSLAEAGCPTINTDINNLKKYLVIEKRKTLSL